MTSRFPSPFEIATPAGCEGWQSMYPEAWLFSQELRDYEDNKFWFYSGMHYPEPLPPLDLMVPEAGDIALGASNSRVFLTPAALGIDHRILNGYVYISGNAIADPQLIEQRAREFERRAGFYYQNWPRLEANWTEKIRATIADVSAIRVPYLPDVEPDAMVFEGRGTGSSLELIVTWNRTIESIHRAWQLHFEMMLLGYGAYMTLLQFCKQAFPRIADQSVARMVGGLDVIVFRPDDELKRLARLALDLGVGPLLTADRTLEALLDELGATESGRRWLAELDRSKQPWFNFSTGDGFYHSHPSWIEDLSLPLAAIRGYVTRLEHGEDLARPIAEIRRERDRLTSEYRQLLGTDEDRATFDQLLRLVRTVFPHVEEHKFYVEHWFNTVFRNKVREFGDLFARHGFLEDREDIFLMRSQEINDALIELLSAWASGGPTRGSHLWPARTRRRKEILARLRDWTPPPALGPLPDEIADPVLMMLWGITPQRLQEWAAPPALERELRGVAASPGVAEGPARVLRSVDQIGSIQAGEILVCQVTAPSWAPIFPKIRAAVSDIGGIMSHAAIVSREYGLPAVVGTGHGTRLIHTGQRIRVDGDRGVVELLDGDVSS
ncbi:MAG TPA: PEP-utilizing enzyme [Chloroflexota bacterium]